MVRYHVTVMTEADEDAEHAIEIPIVTEVNGDDGLVPVRPAANDAYKVSLV